MPCNSGIFLGKHFTQIQGATIGGPESASVTDIFGAEYIEKKAMEGGPMEPKDWKRYKDDTLDIKENCTEEQLEIFTGYLNQNVLKDKIVFEMVNSRAFLDVNIMLKEGYLIPEIYSKPTDSHE